MASYVYLLKHAKDACLKIGKTDRCIHQRAAELGKTNFDYGASWAVRVPDANSAARLERVLQKTFQQFNVDRPAEGDGRTEWYDAECLARALAFLEREADLFDGAVLRVSELPGSSERHPATHGRAPRKREVRSRKDEVLSELEVTLQNDHLARLFLARFAEFQAMASSLFGCSLDERDPHRKTRRLFFVSNEVFVEETFDRLTAAVGGLGCWPYSFLIPRDGRLDSQYVTTDHCLFAYESHFIGNVELHDLGAPGSGVPVSEATRVDYQTAVARFPACPPWLESEVARANAEWWAQVVGPYEDGVTDDEYAECIQKGG